MKHIKVKNEDHLYRDSSTGAIINTDRSSFEKYKKSRNKFRNMEQELDYVKNEVGEIKSLLHQLLKSNGS
jgi:hypothetical protein|tara:strand:- start:1367 stop:1576 length:210 start_codon:yes stop_codon:yes gene_type:complete